MKTVETNIVIMWVDPLVATAEQVTNIQATGLPTKYEDVKLS